MHDEHHRLIAWDAELREAHRRLRRALHAAQESASASIAGRGAGGSPARDLLLYCHGFCLALSAHHLGEDDALFPALEAQHPRLRELIGRLRQDHSMIAHLLTQLDHAVASHASVEHLGRHLEGLAAIMESHFRYEERELLDILSELDLDADPHAVLGPL